MFKYIRNFLLILPGMLFLSCGEMDETYKEFLQDGERVYTGRPDLLEAFSGNERIKLSFDLVSDPNINKVKIFWNNPVQYDGVPASDQRVAGRDSVEIPIVRGQGIDHIETIITNLTEGVYTFEVFTYDKNGNSSIRTEVIGEVYGETYLTSISNRPLNQATFYKNTSNVQLEWFGASQQSIIVEIVYTGIDNELKTTFIKRTIVDPRKPPVFLDKSYFNGCKPETSFKYRTGYLPNPTSIDTFYTNYKVVDEIAVGMFQLPETFKIIAKHSGKALVVSEASTSNGGLVVQATFENAPENVWKMTENADKYIVLTNVNSNRDMAVQSASDNDGALILQWAQGTGFNDEWTLVPVDNEDKYYRIVNRKSGKVVTVIDGSVDDDAGVHQMPWDGSDHQQFELQIVL